MNDSCSHMFGVSGIRPSIDYFDFNDIALNTTIDKKDQQRKGSVIDVEAAGRDKQNSRVASMNHTE